MPRPLVILGTGGGVYDLLDLIEAVNQARPTWRLAGFLDDARAIGSLHLGAPVLAHLEQADSLGDVSFINAIASDRTTRQLPEILARTGLAAERFATLVHPDARVSPRAQLGPGVAVHAGVVIGGAVQIGAHGQLGPRCVIGHETTLGTCVVVAPGAIVSGLVAVGMAAYLGAGSLVRSRVRIGERARVGMGAVVLQEVPAGITVVGNPARPLPEPGPRPDPP